jgi:hypothetical protein
MTVPLYDAVAWTCILTINAILLIAWIVEKRRNAKYQHQIMQTLLTLKQASRVLKEKINDREQTTQNS